jgi:hypothetical protein
MRHRDLRRADLGDRRQGRADPPNPQLLAGGGTLHSADTIEMLAEIAGLPPGEVASSALSP